jgi:hypothetical protein
VDSVRAVSLTESGALALLARGAAPPLSTVAAAAATTTCAPGAALLSGSAEALFLAADLWAVPTVDASGAGAAFGAENATVARGLLAADGARWWLPRPARRDAAGGLELAASLLDWTFVGVPAATTASLSSSSLASPHIVRATSSSSSSSSSPSSSGGAPATPLLLSLPARTLRAGWAYAVLVEARASLTARLIAATASNAWVPADSAASAGAGAPTAPLAPAGAIDGSPLGGLSARALRLAASALYIRAPPRGGRLHIEPAASGTALITPFRLVAEGWAAGDEGAWAAGGESDGSDAAALAAAAALLAPTPPAFELALLAAVEDAAAARGAGATAAESDAAFASGLRDALRVAAASRCDGAALAAAATDDATLVLASPGTIVLAAGLQVNASAACEALAGAWTLWADSAPADAAAGRAPFAPASAFTFAFRLLAGA